MPYHVSLIVVALLTAVASAIPQITAQTTSATAAVVPFSSDPSISTFSTCFARNASIASGATITTVATLNGAKTTVVVVNVGPCSSRPTGPSATYSPPPPNSGGSQTAGNGMTTGMKIGVGIGCAALGAFLVGIVLWWCMPARKKRHIELLEKDDQPPASPERSSLEATEGDRQRSSAPAQQYYRDHDLGQATIEGRT